MPSFHDDFVPLVAYSTLFNARDAAAQADQAHEELAGRERGEALHQGPTDPQGDDDHRPRLRGKGTTIDGRSVTRTISVMMLVRRYSNPQLLTQVTQMLNCGLSLSLQV